MLTSMTVRQHIVDQVVCPRARCEIVVENHLDASTAPEVPDLLTFRSEAGGQHLIIDIDEIEFLDASGLGVLVGASNRIRSVGGFLHLMCTTRLLKIFQVTGLSSVFGLPTPVSESVLAPAFGASGREDGLSSFPARRSHHDAPCTGVPQPADTERLGLRSSRSGSGEAPLERHSTRQPILHRLAP